MGTRFKPEARAPAQAPVQAPVPRAAEVPPARISFPSWKPPTVVSITAFLFYASLLSFVTFIILLIINYTVYPIFSFMPGDVGIISVPVVTDKQSAFTKHAAGNDVSGAFTNMLPCGYTFGMDIFLNGNFVQQTHPRVLMYNAAKPVKTAGDVSKIFPESNIIVWLDPMLNDLYVTAVTMGPKGPVLETTPPIVNVAIKTPFRLTYVYTPEFIEVYRNGSLETSMPLKNKPIGLSAAYPLFFGHVSSRDSVMIGNAAFWPRVLPSREVAASGPSSAAFFKPK